MLTDDQILELRTHFPILHNKTYLYNCSQGALSDAVQQGMTEYARSWQESAAPWDEWVEKYEEIRTVFARFIHAKPEEVAVVTSASAGKARAAHRRQRSSSSATRRGSADSSRIDRGHSATKGERDQVVRGIDVLKDLSRCASACARAAHRSRG